MKIKTTQPQVFIIESNDWEDEDATRREGLILKEILKLSNKPVKYKYVRTKKELLEILKQFKKSKYRYLHIACHGNDNGFEFTIDSISFEDFIEISSPYLENRRLFISACKCINKAFARNLIRKSDCLSVIGPKLNITFPDAAITWASFYSLMFKKNDKGMSGKEIRNVLNNICCIYDVRFDAYFRTKNSPYYNFKTYG